MTPPPTSRPLLAFIVYVALLIAGSTGNNSLAQTDVGTLEPNDPVQRELKAGERHSYRVSLRLGESLHVRVNVWAIRTAIKMFDPDNHQLFSESQVVGVQSTRIFVIGEKAGSYRLEIGATGETGTRGGYEVKVVALGTATAEDRSRFVSQQLEVEANRLVDQQKEQSFVESVVKYQEALRLWDALNSLGIKTLSDLLQWDPVHRARIILAAATNQVAHDLDLSVFVKDSVAGVDPNLLAASSTEVIDGIGEAFAQILAKSFGVTTIAQLADFAPFVEAEQLMRNEVEAFSEPASAPDELVPRSIGAVASTSRYSSFIVDRHLSLEDWNIGRKEVGPETSALIAGFEQGKQLRLGYIALHVQRWIHMGVHLGEVVHSLALAPGESRNIAVVDWKRSLVARRGENTDSMEWLQSEIVQSRALDAVAAGTAQEHQWGQTTALSANMVTGLAIVGGSAFAAGMAGSVAGTATGGLAGLAAGAVIGSAFSGIGAGPGAFAGLAAGSLVGGVAGGVGAAALVGGAMGLGYIKSESKGDRAAAAEERQNIMEITAQKSSAARSLRSTIVVEDQQSGTTTARTLNVTNYNHAHTLNVTPGSAVGPTL